MAGNGAVLGSAFIPYFSSTVSQAEEKIKARERFRVGCVGVGGMGRGDACGFSACADVVAICDIDKNYGIKNALNTKRIGLFRNGKRTVPDTYHDYRELLERKDIDVISIGTPDHWHVKIAIEALQAGKNVFCQKPLTMTLEENQLVRNAAKKYDRLAFQVGTQQRSMLDLFGTAVLMARKGILGKLKRITCILGAGPVSPALPVQKVPDSLDYDFWQGQIEGYPYMASELISNRDVPRYSRCHRTFRYWYEYAGGLFTDWGAHHIDCALWILGLQEKGTGPVSIDGRKAKHPVPFENGMPLVKNCFNTSTEFEISIKFANGVELLVVNDAPDGNGILIEGEDGRIHVNRQRIKGKPYEENHHKKFTEEDFLSLTKEKPREGHKDNFLRCIREGGLPMSDVFTHVQAMNICHLCSIAARLNRVIKWDPVSETILDDPLAMTFFARKQRKGWEIPRV